MNRIQTTTTTNVNTDYAVNVGQVQNTNIQTSNDIPENTTQQSVNTSSPVLSAPGKTDYAGANSFAANYLELIVLMCEMNRDSYEANQDVAKMQIESRIAELEQSASKRMTAAIVGLAFGVIGGALSIGGAAASVNSASKNLSNLKKVETSLHSTGTPDVSGKTGTPDQLTPNPTDVNSTNANQTGVKPQTTDATPDQQNVNTPPDAAEKKEDAKAAQTSDKVLTDEQKTALSTAEAETAKSQAVTMLIRAMSDGFNATGSSLTGIINASADGDQAEAEEIEAQRQVSISNKQAFQDLMSKFNNILSSFLEAEMKAASAAAQA